MVTYDDYSEGMYSWVRHSPAVITTLWIYTFKSLSAILFGQTLDIEHFMFGNIKLSRSMYMNG